MIFNGHADQHFGYITFSQNGEDIMAMNLFSLLGIDRPSYLDLGAHHPTNISNTKLFYDSGSRGVNIEANPNLFMDFLTERPLDLNLNMGIGPENAIIDFLMYDDTSGRNTFSKEESRATVSKHKMMAVTSVKKMAVTTLNDIIKDFCGGQFPQFLSCDIEGLDYAVLDATDFVKSSPMVICVESRIEECSKMVSMLRKKGFIVHCRMGDNLFFIRHDLMPIILKALGHLN